MPSPRRLLTWQLVVRVVTELPPAASPRLRVNQQRNLRVRALCPPRLGPRRVLQMLPRERDVLGRCPDVSDRQPKCEPAVELRVR
jgi:hypothetical protein